MKNRVKELSKAAGVPLGKVEQDLGFAKGYLSKLDTFTPNGLKLKAIADYFGVSVEYLVNGKTGEYYLNPETAKIAQEVFDNRDLRILFEAARNSKPENIRLAAEMLQRFRETNND